MRPAFRPCRTSSAPSSANSANPRRPGARLPARRSARSTGAERAMSSTSPGLGLREEAPHGERTPATRAARRETIRQALARHPRVPLAVLPTPLEPLPRLTAHLDGPRLFVKRDDLTGLAFGGNKTRQLEFVLGDLLLQELDVFVTGANIQ